MSLTKLSLSMESLVSDIPAGYRKSLTLFYSVYAPLCFQLGLTIIDSVIRHLPIGVDVYNISESSRVDVPETEVNIMTKNFKKGRWSKVYLS